MSLTVMPFGSSAGVRFDGDVRFQVSDSGCLVITQTITTTSAVSSKTIGVYAPGAWASARQIDADAKSRK